MFPQSRNSKTILGSELKDHKEKNYSWNTKYYIYSQAQGAGYVRQYDPNLFWHIVSDINKGIFVHTDKERKFKIADIDSDDLYNEFVKLLKESLSARETGRLPIKKKISLSRNAATGESLKN